MPIWFEFKTVHFLVRLSTSESMDKLTTLMTQSPVVFFAMSLLLETCSLPHQSHDLQDQAR